MIPAAIECGVLSGIKFSLSTFDAMNLQSMVWSLLMFSLLQYRSMNALGRVAPSCGVSTPLFRCTLFRISRSQTAAVSCAGVVKIKNLRDFVRGSGAAVESARYINGGGFDSVAIATAKHFLLGYVFVNDESVVDEDFGDARVLRHGADVHELIIQRFLSVWYRLPFGPFSDFAHLVRRFSGVQDLASERRFLKQRIHWVSASSGVGSVFVVGAVKTPFGAKIERVFADLATLLVCASGEAVVHGD